MLPLKRTALVALSGRCLMTRIRLALMLYFFMAAHKAARQTLLMAFFKTMKPRDSTDDSSIDKVETSLE